MRVSAVKQFWSFNLVFDATWSLMICPLLRYTRNLLVRSQILDHQYYVSRLNATPVEFIHSKMADSIPVEEQIKIQGDLVRSLKSQKADKSKVSCFVLLSII